MSPGAQHYAAAYVHRDLATLLASVTIGDLREESRRSQLIAGLREATNRIDTPSGLPWVDPVLGFYSSESLVAIDRRLRPLHPSGSSLQKWIQDRKHDVSRVSTVLDQLIAVRNRVAHGDGFEAPTSVDLRLYVGTAAWFVRDVEAYLAPVLRV